IDGVDGKDDFGESLPPAELYAKILAGSEAHTSQVSVGSYVDLFKPTLEAGKDVVHLTLSSGISGTYNSAVTARDLLAEQYPERKIYIVDSLAASAGYGLLVDKLADLRDEGMSADELVAWAERHKLELNHWFFSTDLTFFIRGGRISKAAGLVGGMLKICPVMNVAHDGSLAVVEKVRTKKRAANRVVEIMKERALDGLNYSDKVFISNSECLEDAHMVGDAIEEVFLKMNGKVQYSNIGSTIGVHTGPGTVALFYWGEPR
uniref:DegV family protein n=1 Tax=uncultured Olegusella sp. TaxID=1979846 RepID=UPI002622B769